jgi:hypothetical protein
MAFPTLLALSFGLCAVALGPGIALVAGQEPSKPAQTTKITDARAPFAPGIVPEALWDGRKMAPFQALDFPKMVSAPEADFLQDGDYVLGVTTHGESRAYPTRFIWWHHVINDKIGRPEADHMIAVTYCSVCNTGIRYDSDLKGKPVKLDFYGLYNGVVVLCERETGSVLLQVDGRFVTGPLLGEKLTPGAVLDTTWGQWKQLHPDTLVMSPDTPKKQFYSPKEKPEPRGYDRFPAPFFRPSMTRGDKRLPFFEKVLAVSVPASGGNTGAPGTFLHRAYPIEALKKAGGVVNDSLGGMPVGVFLDLETAAAVAVARQLDGKTLTFESRKLPDGKPAIFDQETQTQWNIEGKALNGPLKSRSLARLDSHLSQWYGWVAYFPDTSIFGRSDPPQPVDMTASASKDFP